MTEEMYFYKHYTREFLVRVGKLYYATHPTITEAQKKKYEMIHAGLLAELRTVYPAAKDTGTAVYIYDAIGAVLYNRQRNEQELNDRVVANAHTAHEQLKNWR